MIEDVGNTVTYNGNGSATEFAYQFKILNKTDIKVILTDSDGTETLLTKDYYVDSEKNIVCYPGYATGAEIPESEQPPVLPTGWKLTIYRDVPITQETDLPGQYPFNAVEDMGDKLTILCQQLADGVNRSLKTSISDNSDLDITVPWQAGKSFRISEDGTKLELTDDPAKVTPQVQSLLSQTQAQAQIATANATAAANSASSANVYAANAKSYMETTKDYSENVNVFVPSVSSAGVLSWTNKAGLDNPTSVNIKGEKGEQGIQGLTGPKGEKGDTGAAATITIGTVTTGDAGTDASVTNVGTTSAAIFNFTIPRGEDGKDGGITIDSTLSTTSTNPVQNKVITNALAGKADASALATVATSGSYNDLTNKPTIPAAITVDSEVSSTSTNPVQNKAIYITIRDAIVELKKVIVTKANIADLATVATSGSYNDLSDKPNEYVLPQATADILGGIKVGDGLSVLDGLLSATASAANTGGIVAANLADNGYVKFANGLIVQWGNYTKGTRNTTIILPIATSATYAVIAVARTTNTVGCTGSQSCQYVSNVTTTSFQAGSYDSSNGYAGFWWMSIGKI